MRRSHHQQHEHEDPLTGHLRAQYGERVAHGLIEARVAALCSGPAEGQDRLSGEQLARSEVASLAAGGAHSLRRSRR